METEITKRDKAYKWNWENQHRDPKVKRHRFNIGDKVQLKKRKVNKWSLTFEKEYHRITGISGSKIDAKRTSAGRTVVRDASKFKPFNEARNKDWRERLLRSSRRKPKATTNETEPPAQEERNEAREEKAIHDGYN